MARPVPARTATARAAVAPATPATALDVTTVQPLRALAGLADRRRRHGADHPSLWRGQAERAGTFVVLGLLVVSVVPDTGSPLHPSSWWTEPVAYQKFALWGLLWELLGLGGGASTGRPRRLRQPLARTHWTRVDTVRLPPWPGRVLATRGSRRRPVDVGLYTLTVVLAVALLVGPADDGLPGWGVAALIAALVLLGLRDRVPFLASRPDVYLPLLLVAAFPPADTVAAAQLCLAGWWWGRAVASANRSFPFVVALGAGDAPWAGSRLAGAFWCGPAAAAAPSTLARGVAAAVPVAQLVLPVVLLGSGGGALTAAAVVVSVLVQLAAMSALPADAPVETDVFLLLSTVVLFGAGADATGPHSAWLGVLLGAVLGGRVLLGLLAPRAISPVLSLRVHTGTEAVALWLVRADCPDVVADGAAADRQLAARALVPRTGTLLGLVERAVDEPARYRMRDAELVAGEQLGWCLGDARLGGTALLDAVRRRRGDLQPGQLRLVSLAAAGPHRRVHYRITDAATGKLEEGTVERAEAAAYRPFAADSPALAVQVSFRVLPRVQPTVCEGAAGDVPRPVEPVRLGADGTTTRHRPRPRPTREP